MEEHSKNGRWTVFSSSSSSRCRVAYQLSIGAGLCVPCWGLLLHCSMLCLMASMVSLRVTFTLSEDSCGHSHNPSRTASQRHPRTNRIAHRIALQKQHEPGNNSRNGTQEAARLYHNIHHIRNGSCYPGRHCIMPYTPCTCRARKKSYVECTFTKQCSERDSWANGPSENKVDVQKHDRRTEGCSGPEAIGTLDVAKRSY